MKSSAKKVELASVDDLFSTEESRADAQRERVLEIPLSELHPFKNHPFKVKDDESMMETADSIRQYGVLVPAIARPDPEGGYELVAGHRRHRASELAEKETILLVTNTWNIVMGVFDMAQSVVAQASGIISSDTAIDISSVLTDMEPRLMEMDLGPLFGLWFQSMFIGVTMWALYICIFIVIYGRMIEIYLVTSVAPIPMAAMMGKEWGGMGQNYLRSLLALGFQAFLIIVCVAIYAVLVQDIATEEDVIMAIWSCVGYTVLLCFTLFKTGSLAKAVFQAH